MQVKFECQINHIFIISHIDFRAYVYQSSFLDSEGQLELRFSLYLRI